VEFAASCEALRKQVMSEVEAGRLKQIAEALQLTVQVERTQEGTSGVLEGVIPHGFGEDSSHHCTNIGITARNRRDLGPVPAHGGVGAVAAQARRTGTTDGWPRPNRRDF